MSQSQIVGPPWSLQTIHQTSKNERRNLAKSRSCCQSTEQHTNRSSNEKIIKSVVRAMIDDIRRSTITYLASKHGCTRANCCQHCTQIKRQIAFFLLICRHTEKKDRARRSSFQRFLRLNRTRSYRVASCTPSSHSPTGSQPLWWRRPTTPSLLTQKMLGLVWTLRLYRLWERY